MPPTDPEMRFPTPFRGFAEQPVSGQFPTAEFPNGIGLKPRYPESFRAQADTTYMALDQLVFSSTKVLPSRPRNQQTLDSGF